MKLHCLILILFFVCGCESKLRVRNFWINKCSKSQQPIELHDIIVKSDGSGKIKISGTLTANQDLDAPITVALNIKKRFIGLWIPVPCIENIGSCTYTDVCKYAKKYSCPAEFWKNNIPCACPVPQGTYTIPSTTDLNLNSLRAITTGNYIGKIIVKQKKKLLGCFNTKFSLY